MKKISMISDLVADLNTAFVLVLLWPMIITLLMLVLSVIGVVEPPTSNRFAVY